MKRRYVFLEDEPHGRHWEASDLSDWQMKTYDLLS